MKKELLYKNLIYLLLGFFTVSCSKMDSVYKKFVVPNGINYIGKADSVTVYSGKKRVKISWLQGTDPKAAKAIIYWNKKSDSIIVPITETKPGDTVSVIINNLSEGSYIFNIYTLDKYGHASIRVDALGNSYDSLYQSSLLVRPIDTVVSSEKDATIEWFTSDKTSFASEVDYTDTFGVKHTIYVPSDSDQTTLKDYKFSNPFIYRSLYKPDTLCIDTFYTSYNSVKVKPMPQNQNLALNASIADKSSDCSCGRATNITDGDRSTYWQALGSDRKDGELSVTVDLGASETFNKIDQYWKKGDEHISGYTIYYSDDNSTWQTAYINAFGIVADEEAVFQPVTGRYVKVVFELNSSSSEQLNELEIYNDKNAVLPPDLALNTSIADKSSDGSSGRATSLTDGDETTHWQPLGSDRKDDKMVWATIDLGSSQTFNSLNQYWTHGHQHIDSYTIFYSDDNSTWQTAYTSAVGPDAGNNIAAFSPVSGRYIKLKLHFASDGNVNIAEVEVYNIPK